MIDIIGKNRKLTELSTGEFANLRGKGMKFTIQRFCDENLGNVSRICASGFFGLMRMDTVVVCPFHRDAPLFSYDRINAMGKDTLLIELYDTMVGERREYPEIARLKADAASLPEHDLGKHWYDGMKLKESLAKRSGKADKGALDKLACDYTAAFFKIADAAPLCDEAAKKAKTREYVDGLLSNGGPSTDAFIKMIGQEKTEKLFREIVFGVE